MTDAEALEDFFCAAVALAEAAERVDITNMRRGVAAVKKYGDDAARVIVALRDSASGWTDIDRPDYMENEGDAFEAAPDF